MTPDEQSRISSVERSATWCGGRDSNPQDTGFKPAMSAIASPPPIIPLGFDPGREEQSLACHHEPSVVANGAEGGTRTRRTRVLNPRCLPLHHLRRWSLGDSNPGREDPGLACHLARSAARMVRRAGLEPAGHGFWTRDVCHFITSAYSPSGMRTPAVRVKASHAAATSRDY